MPGFESEAKVIQVLEVLEREGGRAHVRVVAQSLWPDSKLWNEEARIPGPTGHRERGVKLHSAAGALLGRLLWHRGLVRKVKRGIYELSPAGRDHLAASRAPKPPIPPQNQAPAWPAGTRVIVTWPNGARYWAFVAGWRPPMVEVVCLDGAHWVIDPCTAYAA